MKTYLSLREAAEKWGVSERRINQYCAEGRIEGAQRIGKVWAVPADAKKPVDPRKTRKQEKAMQKKADPGVLSDLTNLMPLMNTAFPPGECLKTVEGMKAGTGRDIAMAEYHYFSGQSEKAAMETEAYLGKHEDVGAMFSACLIYTYANLSLGRIRKSREGLDAIGLFLCEEGKRSPEFRAAAAFIASAGSVQAWRRRPLPWEPSAIPYRLFTSTL